MIKLKKSRASDNNKRFKSFNICLKTQYSSQQKALYTKLFWPKRAISISKSAKYGNRQNLWLRFSKLKLAYHLTSWVIFLNLSKKHTPCEQIRNSGQRIQTTKYGIETKKKKKKWQNLFSNECKATIFIVEAKIKSQVPENSLRELCKRYINQIGFI